MNTMWRKGVRDLLGERTRSLSIAFALASGIGGFLAVLSTYAILTRALNDGYLATNPESATLSVDRLDDDAVAAAAAVAGVQHAEARATVRGRVKTGPAQWKNLMLFTRRDFDGSRIATISPESGAWPPADGELSIERDALQVAGANVGDVVTVRTEIGVEHNLRVAGTVHDVGQAQARMENLVYGYVTPATLDGMGVEFAFDELVILVASRTLDEAHIRSVAAAVAEVLEARGLRVRRVDVPEPGQHPHARIMGLLLLTNAVFGLVVVLMSGTIVFNVLTALLAGQVKQIGVMKAVGGSRRQIARVYLLEATLLGAAGILIGVPLGLAAGRQLCRFFAVFLNFDVDDYSLPLWVYGLVLVVGIAVPVLAAVIPVWLGTRVSVREALTPGSLMGRAYGGSVIDRALARVSGPSRTLLLAMRNAGRNRLRASLTLLTLAASGMFFMSALNVRQSMIGMLDRLYETRRADLMVDLAAEYPAESVEAAVRAVEGVAVAEAWMAVNAELSDPQQEAAAVYLDGRKEIGIVGVPPGSRLIAFDLVAGAGWDESPDGAIVNGALFDQLTGPGVGDFFRVRIDGKESEFRIAGVAREPFSPPAAYVSTAYFERETGPRTANSLRVAASNPDSESLAELTTAIDSSLSENGIRAQQTRTKAETRFVLDQHMVMVYVFLIVVSLILGAIGALGLVTTVSLNVSERRREMAVMRAIGATPAAVAKIVVLESVALGAAAWIIAVLAAGPAGKAIGDMLLGMMFRSDPDLVRTTAFSGVAAWLAVSAIGCAAASLWPALRASRASVREGLMHE